MRNIDTGTRNSKSFNLLKFCETCNGDNSHLLDNELMQQPIITRTVRHNKNSLRNIAASFCCHNLNIDVIFNSCFFVVFWGFFLLHLYCVICIVLSCYLFFLHVNWNVCF